MWLKLKDTLYELYPNLHTKGSTKEAQEHLCTYLKTAWWAIPREFIFAVINSMYDRLTKVKTNNGYQTSY
ncbi:hypothetical protein PSPO01_15092 [Paraphaeosphaeria sporulosa]